MRSWGRIAREAGPYVVCAAVLWRMATWERALTALVKANEGMADHAVAKISETLANGMRDEQDEALRASQN